VYAGVPNAFITYTSPSNSSAITANYNLYNSAAGSAGSTWVWRTTSLTGFSAYQSNSGQDVNSGFADPMFVSLTTPNFHVAAASPAVNTGNTLLGSTIFGTLDLAGNARVQGSNVDKGAFEQ
jgi:hypothetical protein